MSLRLSGVKKSHLLIKKDALKCSGELDSARPGYERSRDLESISKNDITSLGVSGSAPHHACDINSFETNLQVMAGAQRVVTADNLGRKIKENTGQLSSGALVWCQMAKSADIGTWQEKKRGLFPLHHVARPERNKSLGTCRLKSGSLESNKFALHTHLERQARNEYINLDRLFMNSFFMKTRFAS